MPGLAIATASSAAWATMGSQAETAWNSGWGFDQRSDGAGGWTSNASPTSSGFTFQSTGNATAFYLTGRGLTVVQVGGTTTFCTVGLSSFSGGITNVFINQFSTQGSTVMSTGVITSVAASPVILGFGGNLGGLFSIIVSTGGDSSIAIGANPATAGVFRIPNGVNIAARTGAGTADQPLMQLNVNNQLILGGGAGGIDLFAQSLSVGANPSTGGALRLGNNIPGGIAFRNNANNGNLTGFNINAADTATIWDARLAGATVARSIILDALGHGPANGVIWGTT